MLNNSVTARARESKLHSLSLQAISICYRACMNWIKACECLYINLVAKRLFSMRLWEGDNVTVNLQYGCARRRRSISVSFVIRFDGIKFTANDFSRDWPSKASPKTSIFHTITTSMCKFTLHFQPQLCVWCECDGPRGRCFSEAMWKRAIIYTWSRSTTNR